MTKKYEITDETTQKDNRTLHRIRAIVDIPLMNVRAGDLGGWIESEDNLSHFGDSWIGGVAKVYGSAKVHGNARVDGKVVVCDRAKVYGNARVGDNVLICDRAKVYGNALVYGRAWIGGDARVGNDALLRNTDLQALSKSGTKC